MKRVRYLFEAIIVKFGLWFFGFLNIEAASNLAALISKFVGKKISVNNLACKNLSRAMPHLSENERGKIIDDMWDNLGRIVGEFPHIAKLSPQELSKVVTISAESKKNIDDLKNMDRGGIIFSAHIGNWEVGPKFFIANGLKVSTVYRPLNNPYVEKMTANLRGVDMIEKGSGGNRKILEAIKNGGFVVILADQKISDGEPVKFFHDDAITTTSIARIALRYNVPLIPAYAVRIGNGFKFYAELKKPLVTQITSDANSDITVLTRAINRELESWILKYPSQWFWVHDRWKKKHV